MAAPMIASIKGKVLIQIEGSDPVEVGEVEIPVTVCAERRGQEITDAVASLVTKPDLHVCTRCTSCTSDAEHCASNCPRPAAAKAGQ